MYHLFLQETCSLDDPDADPFGASSGIPNRGYMSHSEKDLKSYVKAEQQINRSVSSLRSMDTYQPRKLPGNCTFYKKIENSTQETYSEVAITSSSKPSESQFSQNTEENSSKESEQGNKEIAGLEDSKPSMAWLFNEDETFDGAGDQGQVSDAPGYSNPGFSKDKAFDLPEIGTGRKAWANIKALNQKRRRSRHESAVVQPTRKGKVM